MINLIIANITEKVKNNFPIHNIFYKIVANSQENITIYSHWWFNMV